MIKYFFNKSQSKKDGMPENIKESSENLRQLTEK